MADYLAVILTPYGGGSFARSAGTETKEQVAMRARKIFVSDWKHLLGKPKPGAKIKANVVDVTDIDVVSWDDTGFYQGEADKRIPLGRPVEIIEV